MFTYSSENFRHALESQLQSRFQHSYPRMAEDPHSLPRVELMVGEKYTRIVHTCMNERRVYGFIDHANGNLLKAGSWKAPLPKYPRGNIYKRDQLEWCTATGLRDMPRQPKKR